MASLFPFTKQPISLHGTVEDGGAMDRLDGLRLYAQQPAELDLEREADDTDAPDARRPADSDALLERIRYEFLRIRPYQTFYDLFARRLAPPPHAARLLFQLQEGTRTVAATVAFRTQLLGYAIRFLEHHLRQEFQLQKLEPQQTTPSAATYTVQKSVSVLLLFSTMIHSHPQQQQGAVVPSAAATTSYKTLYWTVSIADLLCAVVHHKYGPSSRANSALNELYESIQTAVLAQLRGIPSPPPLFPHQAGERVSLHLSLKSSLPFNIIKTLTNLDDMIALDIQQQTQAGRFPVNPSHTLLHFPRHSHFTFILTHNLQDPNNAVVFYKSILVSIKQTFLYLERDSAKFRFAPTDDLTLEDEGLDGEGQQENNNNNKTALYYDTIRQQEQTHWTENQIHPYNDSLRIFIDSLVILINYSFDFLKYHFLIHPLYSNNKSNDHNNDSFERKSF
ncbi:hypothetical protein STCU_11669 [Strigomonas culicis]|uniref:Uncharacterized protein n=1 Tax=Strigomonas culicis TaxID=28005 RepID=S9TD24_9TRYP|nr:hypothetical protein STCU_11669 [Strigomonas culicis]|eukprot:EPY15932.1 hypothetical protein STCU_11669 [Strigomonas culicis]